MNILRDKFNMNAIFSKVTDGLWDAAEIQNGRGIINIDLNLKSEILDILTNLDKGIDLKIEYYNYFAQFMKDLEQQILHKERFALIKTIPAIKEFSIETFEKFSLFMTNFIGYPLSQSYKGNVISRVHNANVDYNDPNARGHLSNQEILPHTDTGDAASLLCISQSLVGGTTYIVNTRKIFNTICDTYPEYIPYLFDGYPNFKKIEDIHIAEDYYNFPVYINYENELSCSFNSRLIKAALQNNSSIKLSSIQKNALEYFESLLYDKKLVAPIKLQPGEILIMNNYDVIHYRDAFSDLENGERFLLRVWFNLNNPRKLPEFFSKVTRTGIPIEYHQQLDN
jgi:hypothetical protein